MSNEPSDLLKATQIAVRIATIVGTATNNLAGSIDNLARAIDDLARVQVEERLHRVRHAHEAAMSQGAATGAATGAALEGLVTEAEENTFCLRCEELATAEANGRLCDYCTHVVEKENDA